MTNLAAKYEFIHQNKNIMEKFSKETYERFISMVEKNQIIVVAHRINSRSFTQDYKIIGATSDGRWDFTPMVAYVTDCKTNGADARNLACRGLYGDILIYKRLQPPCARQTARHSCCSKMLQEVLHSSRCKPHISRRLILVGIAFYSPKN